MSSNVSKGEKYYEIDEGLVESKREKLNEKKKSVFNQFCLKVFPTKSKTCRNVFDVCWSRKKMDGQFID